MKKVFAIAPLAVLMAGIATQSFAAIGCVDFPPGDLSSIKGGGQVSGDTCADDTSLANICSNNQAKGQVGVWSWTHNAGAVSGNLVVTSTAAGFDPAIGVSHGATCLAADGQPCDAGGVKDSNHGGSTSETIDVSTLTAATTYFLWITSFDSSLPCGTYNLQVTGTLPVKLEKFSIN